MLIASYRAQMRNRTSHFAFGKIDACARNKSNEIPYKLAGLFIWSFVWCVSLRHQLTLICEIQSKLSPMYERKKLMNVYIQIDKETTTWFTIFNYISYTIIVQKTSVTHQKHISFFDENLIWSVSSQTYLLIFDSIPITRSWIWQ